MTQNSLSRLVLLTFVVANAARAQSVPVKKDIPTIAKSAKGAIVTIVMTKGDDPLALGTGFLVRADGVIITNYHVIESGNNAFVKFADGKVFQADGVLACDKIRDLAVIKIHGQSFSTLLLGNSDQIQVGEEVVAIGNPQGLELTVSNGILSGVRTDKEAGGKFLQITAPITHGNSGGPLFNMRGEVVGITTMGLTGGGDLNFAVPSNDAKRLLGRAGKLKELPDEQASVQDADQAGGDKGADPNLVQEMKMISWLQAKSGHRNEKSDELKETLQWIQDTLHQGSLECLQFKSLSSCNTTELRQFVGCTVSFETVMSVPTATDHTKFHHMSSDYYLDLGNIDPERIASRQLSDDYPQEYEVFEFSIWNDRKTILRIDLPPNELQNKLSFILKPDYGIRFEKAFRRAVDLCGGKPSTLQF